jgi:hypothetical protein
MPLRQPFLLLLLVPLQYLKPLRAHALHLVLLEVLHLVQLLVKLLFFLLEHR